MEEKEHYNCSECMKQIVKGYFIGPGDEKAFLCTSCSRSFCSSCGFFDEHDDYFLCNQCWLNKAKGYISHEKYIAAMWIFKQMGRSRDVEEMKRLELERRRRLKIGDKVIEKKAAGYIEKSR
jgi:hypothetical protein